MGDLGNFGSLLDFVNARESWLSSRGKSDRAVIFWKFLEYKTTTSTNPNESIRQTVYAKRSDHVWLSFVKVFDTVKRGYFTTGDLDIISEFSLQGYSQPYSLPNGVQVPEYAGDLIQWNGKVWEVADVQEPIQWGYQNPEVWYHTVLRRANLTGTSVAVGP